MSRGIIYVYEDGGKFCGEWEDDQAHGHGVCTGPQGMGTFEGLWERGDQVSGVFMWPTGQKNTGKWKKGLRDGLGKESKSDGTEYVGEFTRDLRGPYGVLQLSKGAVYRGTWSGGVQDGEGVETYIDGGRLFRSRSYTLRLNLTVKFRSQTIFCHTGKNWSGEQPIPFSFPAVVKL